MRPRSQPEDGGEVWVVVADVFIGFLVVVILVALPRSGGIAASRPSATPVPAPNFSDLQHEYEELRIRVDQIALENEKLAKRVDALQQQVDQLKGLHSPALPTCKYAGLAAGSLFEARIQGSDRFEIGGQAYSLDQIGAKFREQLDAAAKGKCRHTVGVCYGSGLNVPDANAARQELQRFFYVGELSGQRCAALFPRK